MGSPTHSLYNAGPVLQEREFIPFSIGGDTIVLDWAMSASSMPVDDFVLLSRDDPIGASLLTIYPNQTNQTQFPGLEPGLEYIFTLIARGSEANSPSITVRLRAGADPCKNP